MKRPFLIIVTCLMAMISTGAQSDFSCPQGTERACLDAGDKVCPGSTRCVVESATCFDEYPCGLNGGFVCESRYDGVLKDYKQAVNQHNQLASENEDLRVKRLAQKNCVVNSSTLEDAKRCVR